MRIEGIDWRMPDPAALETPVRTRAKAVRRPLPDHLPRETVLHEPTTLCTCSTPAKLARLGEDVSEVLEKIPARLKVIRHVRPRYACRVCEAVFQAPAPDLPIERGRPGPGLIAHVAVSKYCDGLPLYRQSVILAREGVELDRVTLADWIGRAAWWLAPLARLIGTTVMAQPVLHTDDTPNRAQRLTLTEELDLCAILSAYTEPRGYPPYHPAMMVALLLYGYSRGV